MRQKPDADIYNSPAMQAALGIYSRHGALAAGWDAPDEDRRTGLLRQKMSERREKGDEKK